MGIITFFNSKGGAGKTTLVCHTTPMLWESGYEVLAVDLANTVLSATCSPEMLTLVFKPFLREGQAAGMHHIYIVHHILVLECVNVDQRRVPVLRAVFHGELVGVGSFQVFYSLEQRIDRAEIPPFFPRDGLAIVHPDHAGDPVVPHGDAHLAIQGRAAVCAQGGQSCFVGGRKGAS